jgi:hypothetical protein
MTQSIVDRIRQALKLDADPRAKKDTDRLVDDACDVMVSVRTARSELQRDLRERPDLARALLLARDGRSERP